MTRVLVGTIVAFTVAASATAAQDRTRSTEELQRRVDRFAREVAARQPVRRCGMPVAPVQPAGDRMALPVRPDALSMPTATPRCEEARPKPRQGPAFGRQGRDGLRPVRR